MAENAQAATMIRCNLGSMPAGHIVRLPPFMQPPQYRPHFEDALKAGEEGAPAGSYTSSISPLSGKATPFEPSGSQLLLEGSTSDASGPTIVQSPVATTSSGKNKGKKAALAGTKDGQDLTVRPGNVFTTDFAFGGPFQQGHYLCTKIAHEHDLPRALRELFENYDWKFKLLGRKVAPPEFLSETLCLYLHFDDVRHAAQAQAEANAVNSGWKLEHVTQQEYEAAGKRAVKGSKEPTFFYDGQVRYSARYEGNPEDMKSADLSVLAQAHEAGDMIAFVQEASSYYVGQLYFRAEYHSITAARKALEGLTEMDPAVKNDWYITAHKLVSTNDFTRINPDGTPQKPPHGQVFSPSGRSSWKHDNNGQSHAVPPLFTLPKVPQSPDDMLHPAVQTWRDRMMSAPAMPGVQQFGSLDVDLSVLSMLDQRSYSYPGFAPAIPRWRHQPDENEPQYIKLDRIRSGEDVRTTIMLRNLPNVWTIREFLAALNSVCEGKFDFSYLRIDFERCANVGYGFVNFTKAEYIIPFYQKYIGKEWSPGSHPRKIAQISYATVQGVDCLTEKFRNSAIMDEFIDYQPKLWYVDGPDTKNRPELIGKVKPFPPPNNLTKKQRSDDNAKSIGLYARRGPRGHTGGRRSQYDRGTTHQIQEEAMYNHSPTPGTMYPQDANYTYIPRGLLGAAPHFQQQMYHPGMVPYPHMQAPYYNGHAGYQGFAPPPQHADPFYNHQYAGPAYAPYPPQQGYPAPAPYPYHQQHPQMMINGTPASRLRTITEGRLGGRPRHVSVAPQGYTDAGDGSGAGPAQHGWVPRSFAATTEQIADNSQAAPPQALTYGDAGAAGSVSYYRPHHEQLN